MGNTYIIFSGEDEVKGEDNYDRLMAAIRSAKLWAQRNRDQSWTVRYMSLHCQVYLIVASSDPSELKLDSKDVETIIGMENDGEDPIELLEDLACNKKIGYWNPKKQ